MKHCHFALVFGALFLVGCASREADPEAITIAPENQLKSVGTTNFSSKDANFSIFFPLKPTEKRTTGDSEWGKYEMLTFQGKNDTMTYIIVATKIPSGVDMSDVGGHLEGTVTGFLKGSQGKLVSQREISLDGMPGRDATISMSGGSVTSRVLFLYTPQISYQIMAGGANADMQKNKATVEKFHRSFRLLSP